jgi:hypothetical protein
VIFNAQIDSRLEGWVKYLNSIRGEKMTALVVFKETKEDSNECVPFHIIPDALGQEKVG